MDDQAILFDSTDGAFTTVEVAAVGVIVTIVVFTIGARFECFFDAFLARFVFCRAIALFAYRTRAFDFFAIIDDGSNRAVFLTRIVVTVFVTIAVVIDAVGARGDCLFNAFLARFVFCRAIALFALCDATDSRIFATVVFAIDKAISVVVFTIGAGIDVILFRCANRFGRSERAI